MPEYLRGVEVSEFMSQRHRADVVIIGAGIIGPAIAWGLNQLNPGKNFTTVVLEARSDLASLTSANSVENIRTAWTPRAIAEQSIFSRKIFLNADDYFGRGAQERLNVTQREYLWCATNAKEIQSLIDSVELLNSWGLNHVKFLSGDELHKQYPWLPPSIIAGKIDPCSGSIDSNSLAHLYAESSGSTSFLFDTNALEIIVSGNKVCGVKTGKGTIATNNVVIAAGPGSREIAKTAGINLNIVCIPRQMFTTEYRHKEIPSNSPFIIGSYPNPYFRPNHKGMIFGWANRTKQLEKPSWPIENHKDIRFPGITLELLARQFKDKPNSGFRDPGYLMNKVNHHIGYYVHRLIERVPIQELSERDINDKVDGIDGLFLAVAKSGHGIMTSAATGMITAAYILEKEQRVPLWEHFKLNVNRVDHENGSGL